MQTCSSSSSSLSVVCTRSMGLTLSPPERLSDDHHHPSYSVRDRYRYIFIYNCDVEYTAKAERVFAADARKKKLRLHHKLSSAAAISFFFFFCCCLFFWLLICASLLGTFLSPILEHPSGRGQQPAAYTIQTLPCLSLSFSSFISSSGSSQ